MHCAFIAAGIINIAERWGELNKPSFISLFFFCREDTNTHSHYHKMYTCMCIDFFSYYHQPTACFYNATAMMSLRAQRVVCDSVGVCVSLAENSVQSALQDSPDSEWVILKTALVSLRPFALQMSHIHFLTSKKKNNILFFSFRTTKEYEGDTFGSPCAVQSILFLFHPISLFEYWFLIECWCSWYFFF